MHCNTFGYAVARAIMFGSLVLWAGGSGIAAAQGSNDITLRLGATTGNPEDTIELTLDLEADSVLPESFVIFLTYDPALLTPKDDAYELILRDPLSGEPILDGDGNTVAVTSALRPSDNVRAAGKAVDSEVYGTEGVLGISIQGLNMEPVTPGALFTIAFQVAGDVGDGEMTTIAGVSEGSEVLIPDGSGGVVAVSSSVARSVETTPGNFDVVDVTYAFEDAAVVFGCAPPAAPGGVMASQNRTNDVAVSWNAVAGEGIEYRVFRSTTSDAASAAPIGEGWQSATTFSDITARVPEVVPGDGCNIPDQLREVRYFYWVKARFEEGCESALSAAPAVGFRTQAAARAASSGAAYALVLAVLLLTGRTRRRMV